MYDFDKV
jgi:superfamily II DNA or RNA helicase